MLSGRGMSGGVAQLAMDSLDRQQAASIEMTENKQLQLFAQTQQTHRTGREREGGTDNAGGGQREKGRRLLLLLALLA
jgi:hypothetical protein